MDESDKDSDSTVESDETIEEDVENEKSPANISVKLPHENSEFFDRVHRSGLSFSKKSYGDH